jgi:hypothetical protein
VVFPWFVRGGPLPEVEGPASDPFGSGPTLWAATAVTTALLFRIPVKPTSPARSPIQDLHRLLPVDGFGQDGRMDGMAVLLGNGSIL